LGSSEDRENFGWVQNSKIDFSLARNTIVGGQYKVTIGQSAFVLVGKRLCSRDAEAQKQINSVCALSEIF